MGFLRIGAGDGQRVERSQRAHLVAGSAQFYRIFAAFHCRFRAAYNSGHCNLHIITANLQDNRSDLKGLLLLPDRHDLPAAPLFVDEPNPVVPKALILELILRVVSSLSP